MSEVYDHPLANYPALPPRGEDLPCDDGEPMESERHRDQMVLLIESLRWAWKDRRDYFVGGNMFVYFSVAQAKNNDFRGPDVFVVMDAKHKETRRSWVVWEEDGRTPDVVIELLSPKTEKIDRGEKMTIYARAMRVPAYYLYDPWTYVLEGYRLDEDTHTYERMIEDEDGLLPCAPLGLRVGIRESALLAGDLPWLRWFDERGEPLPLPEETATDALRRADEEKRRADEEKRRADALAARIAELERPD